MKLQVFPLHILKNIEFTNNQNIHGHKTNMKIYFKAFTTPKQYIKHPKKEEKRTESVKGENQYYPQHGTETNAIKTKNLYANLVTSLKKYGF